MAGASIVAGALWFLGAAVPGGVTPSLRRRLLPLPRHR